MSRDGPVVLIVDRDPDARDRVGAWLEDTGLDLIETIRVISKDVFVGDATITTTNWR